MNLFRRPTTVVEPEPPPDPEPPDVEALLDRALGEPLAAAAHSALMRAQHGLPCGRLGKSYSSQYEAAVDFVLGNVEQQLAEAKDAQRRSVAAAPRAELADLLGDDEPLAPRWWRAPQLSSSNIARKFCAPSHRSDDALHFCGAISMPKMRSQN